MRESGLEAQVAVYVDRLDAALVDGFLATYEQDELLGIATSLGLSADRLEHIHRGYFIALAVTAWDDGVVTFEEQAQLTMVAAALSIPFDEAFDLALTARDVEPPLLLSGLGLTARDRIAFVDPLSSSVQLWHHRAEAAGLSATYDTRSARYVVTSDPNDTSHAELWTRGAMVIAEWAFVSSLELLEEQRRRRNLVL